MLGPFLLCATTSSSAPAPSASTCTHSYRAECSSQSTSTPRAIRSWYSSPRRRAPLRVIGLLTPFALGITVHAPFYPVWWVRHTSCHQPQRNTYLPNADLS